MLLVLSLGMEIDKEERQKAGFSGVVGFSVLYISVIKFLGAHYELEYVCEQIWVCLRFEI